MNGRVASPALAEIEIPQSCLNLPSNQDGHEGLHPSLREARIHRCHETFDGLSGEDGVPRDHRINNVVIVG